MVFDVSSDITDFRLCPSVDHMLISCMSVN